MNPFTLFPAIDLRRGSVVRLTQGDPKRQTVYGENPAEVARRWLEKGARWLHVVNLDGAFGETDNFNRAALKAVLETAAAFNARVQFGGGLRSFENVQAALELGVERAVIGTMAVEQPEILSIVLETFGSERVAVSLDARDGLLRTHGWLQGTETRALDLARRLKEIGLRWLVFTDVALDGTGRGPNLQATIDLAKGSGLMVIASGGVDSPEDIQAVRRAGLAGVIVGRALYEGKIDLGEFFLPGQPPPAGSPPGRLSG